MGMAMRGRMSVGDSGVLFCSYSGDGRESFGLTVMTDFHHRREKKDDTAGDERGGQGDVAVGDPHIRVDMAMRRDRDS
jgi:hypothetical protein